MFQMKAQYLSFSINNVILILGSCGSQWFLGQYHYLWYKLDSECSRILIMKQMQMQNWSTLMRLCSLWLRYVTRTITGNNCGTMFILSKFKLRVKYSQYRICMTTNVRVDQFIYWMQFTFFYRLEEEATSRELMRYCSVIVIGICEQLLLSCKIISASNILLKINECNFRVILKNAVFRTNIEQ